MKTTAVRKGDSWVVNGTKIWITNGGLADIVAMFCNVKGEGESDSGPAAFIVEKTFPGFRVGKVEEKMGIRGSNTVELVFEDMQVPAANLVGEVGQGARIAFGVLEDR